MVRIANVAPSEPIEVMTTINGNKLEHVSGQAELHHRAHRDVGFNEVGGARPNVQAVGPETCP